MRRTYLPAIMITVVGLIVLLVFSLYADVPQLLAQTAQPQEGQQAQGAQSAGTNWIGQFYNNTSLSGAPVNTALYPTGLNQNWANNPPSDGAGTTIPGVNSDNWSGRFTATENIAAGLYEFVLLSDDGARLYIDGNLIIDNYNNTGLSRASVVLTLSGGVYTIIVDYRDVTGPAVLQLNWFTTQPTPEFTPTPVPLAEAQVDSNRVRGLALRTGPYLGASLINVLRPGKTYPVTGQNFSEGIYTWYRIRVPSTGQSGWASGRYLSVTGTAVVTTTCPLTADFALAVVQRLLPTYTDKARALTCIDTIQKSQYQSAATNQCVPILNFGASKNTFFDVVDLGNELIAACNFSPDTVRYNLPILDSVFDVINNRPDLGVAAYPRAVMNFRTRPSERAAVIGDLKKIPWGAEMSIIGRTVQEGKDFWYQVRYQGRVGWVKASYVRIKSGDIDKVPIY